MVDLLTDVLQSVRVDAARCGFVDGAECWAADDAGCECAVVYAVLAGACSLQVGPGRATTLVTGDIALLVHGDAHRLSCGASATAVPIHLVWSPASASARTAVVPPAPLRLARIELSFEDKKQNPVVSALPTMVRLTNESGQTPRWFEPVLQLMICEAASDLPGSESILCRLGDVLMIQLVRGHLQRVESHPPSSAACPGWLAAISEPQIGSALGLIHESPAEPWTVAGLAARVGMSRSAFAARFAQLVGEPPLHYVTRWRMQKAATMLRASTSTLADIAARVGYESEAAFSKAFKRWAGVAPGAFRRASRHHSIASAAA